MGNNHATTTSTVSIPREVMDNYRSVYNRAETAASQPFKAFGNTASDYVAQINAQQNAGIADINATAGSYKPYMTQATSATQAGMGPAYEGIENYMSPYTKNVADTTGAMMRQQQEQAQSGALGTAAMSGAFGGDRAGIAAANMQQQNQMGYGKTMADIMNQGYTQALGASQADLARQLQGGAQMAALGAQSQQLGLQGAQAKLAAGTLQQQTEQAGKDAMINRFMQEQGFPYQQAQFLANIAMGTGALSGSTTTTQTPRNWAGFEAGGRVEGYAGGGGVIGPMEYGKASIGGQSYVPEASLPVGELMIAEPPQDQGGGGNQQMMQMLQMVMGAARGGVIDARHGYATDGFVYEGPNSALGRDQAALYGPRQMMPRGHYLQPGRDGQFEDFMPPSATGVAPTPIAVPPRVGLMPAQIQRNPEDVQSRLSGFNSERQPVLPVTTTLGNSPAATAPNMISTPRGMPDRPISLTPRSGLAPTESPRPLPRPAGGVAGAEDIAADTMAVLGNEPAATGVVAPNTGPQTNTGVAPEGGYAPIIPLKTQLQFVTNELQQPEYSGFLKQTYASPADAATAFDAVYEKSRGANDGEARANANDIYRAVQNGNLENLPPNVVEAYNHFIQNGMDPIQASGAAGRLMVESYAHLDPNARNTIGGGNGTYGIAQWRGDRIEKLANFAGVPMESIINAPVSTPEGRYYSTKGDSNGVVGPNAMTQIGGGDNTGLAGGVKPYEERNAIGKFFHNPNGTMNQTALLSFLSGLGRAVEAPTISPIGAILSGVGAGANTYKELLKQNADIGLTKAQTANEAVQLFKNSVYYDQSTGQSFIPLQGGGSQSLADFITKPAGPSMAGPAADDIIRSIVGGKASRGLDLTTATPSQIFGDGTEVAPAVQTSVTQAPPAGMPAVQVSAPYESFGTFPLDEKDQAFITQAESRARSFMSAQEREALTLQAATARAAADSGTAAASMSFKNTNELAATVAKAVANNDLGPLGGYKASLEGLASQVAGQFGIQYDGGSATSQALLNKLSSLSADQMTADTAAASLYLQNKGIFPGIDSNPVAAAEITASMMTSNMTAYEKGQYVNDLYRAQKGIVKDLTGADARFNEKAGDTYQVEKANIADLLKYAGNAESDPELKKLVVEFFDSANRGAFQDQADAQAALDSIFGAMYANSPDQHRVSNGLGRYFVQQGNS
jgi:hypothetical protein